MHFFQLSYRVFCGIFGGGRVNIKRQVSQNGMLSVTENNMLRFDIASTTANIIEEI